MASWLEFRHWVCSQDFSMIPSWLFWRLCLMDLLHWNDLSLVLFVRSRRCFLYLLSLSFPLFPLFHVIGGIFFISKVVLGIVFSAVCRMFLVRQIYGSFIYSWSRIFVIIMPFLWSSVQFALFMLHLCCCLVEFSLSSLRMIKKWLLPLVA